MDVVIRFCGIIVVVVIGMVVGEVVDVWTVEVIVVSGMVVWVEVVEVSLVVVVWTVVGWTEVVSFVVVIIVVCGSGEPVMYPVIGRVWLELFSWVWFVLV